MEKKQKLHFETLPGGIRKITLPGGKSRYLLPGLNAMANDRLIVFESDQVFYKISDKKKTGTVLKIKNDGSIIVSKNTCTCHVCSDTITIDDIKMVYDIINN